MIVTVDPSPTEVVHEPTWFGEGDSALFGWLSSPKDDVVRGGVILALPVGFEARGARKAMRALATSLAQSGFLALRFDYRGTGDSSGDFGSTLANPGWIEDVASAVDYLRGCGVHDVSAVGMRLGATLVGLAASSSQLDLRSVVAWDPCESGRGFLRELRALETLRHQDVAEYVDGSVETAEFLFAPDMVESIKSLKLLESTPALWAKRALVISREGRPLSTSLREHLDAGNVEFETTTEQESSIGIHPFFSVAPVATITRIVGWLGEDQEERTIRPQLTPCTRATLSDAEDGRSVVEQVVRVGPRRLFAITSEPRTETTSPWIVFLSGVHEDHTGPSRLWVEISRRLAASGLRCVRIDLSGSGESPRRAEDPLMRGNDPVWIRDAREIGLSLTPADPTNCVYVGYCSGAFLAVETAYGSGARGLCTINLPPSTDFSHVIWRLEDSVSSLAARTSAVMRRTIRRHSAVGELLWLPLRWLLPRRWSTNTMAEIMSRGTRVLAIVGPADQSAYQNVPLLRRLGGPLTRATRPYPPHLVPTLDHDMSFAQGRRDMAEVLESFVLSEFLTK